MRKAAVATRGKTPTPHPYPSPQGEGKNTKALLPREKGTLEAKQKGRDEGHSLLMKNRARSLRRSSIDAEIILWHHLRGRRLLGYKFRRQVPIGKYIVDFLCEDKAIIIELDGGHHMKQENHDLIRTDWLEANGFCVLRFWNNDVMGNTDAVLERLLPILHKHPPAKKP